MLPVQKKLQISGMIADSPYGHFPIPDWHPLIRNVHTLESDSIIQWSADEKRFISPEGFSRHMNYPEMYKIINADKKYIDFSDKKYRNYPNGKYLYFYWWQCCMYRSIWGCDCQIIHSNCSSDADLFNQNISCLSIEKLEFSKNLSWRVCSRQKYNL